MVDWGDEKEPESEEEEDFLSDEEADSEEEW